MIEGDRKEERRDIDLPKIFPLSCVVLDFEVIVVNHFYPGKQPKILSVNVYRFF